MGDGRRRRAAAWRTAVQGPRPRLAGLAMVCAALAACGGGDAGAADAGPPIDARHVTDAALVVCSADAGCADRVLAPTCDPDRGVCVECVFDRDCERSGAFGPRCDPGPGYCQCGRDQDCAGNANGPYCDGITRACTCLLDGDCASGQECHLEPYLGRDVRTCHPDADR